MPSNSVAGVVVAVLVTGIPGSVFTQDNALEPAEATPFEFFEEKIRAAT